MIFEVKNNNTNLTINKKNLDLESEQIETMINSLLSKEKKLLFWKYV